MKTAPKSKTIWTGVFLTVSSIVAVFLDIWTMLSPEHLEFLRDLFGPKLVAGIGIIMIALRVVTRDALAFNEGETSE